MGLRAAWRGLWEREAKESLSHPILAMFGAGRAVPTPREYDKLAREGFQRNAVVFRCVNLIAESAAAVSWQLFSGTGDDRQQIEQHPLLELLKNPNPFQGGSAFFQSLYAYRLLAGNTYIEAAGPTGGARAGQPRELWILRPDRMRVIKGARGVPAGYEFETNGKKVRWDFDPLNVVASPILHSKSFHPLDDYYGLSPLEAAAFEIDQHNAAGRHNYSLLANGARPDGAVVYTPPDEASSDVLSDEQFKRVQREIDEHSGPDNAGRPMILEGGLDWRPMAMSPKDMDFANLRDMSGRDIAMAYDVPPQLVGIEGSQTFANFEQARLSLYEDAVLPLVDDYADELNRWLVPRYGENLELCFDQDAIPALMVRRREKWEMIGQTDVLTINEKRLALGFDAIEGGDVLLVPANLLPLDSEPENEPEDDEARALVQLPIGGLTPEQAREQFHLAYGDSQDREPPGAAA